MIPARLQPFSKDLKIFGGIFVKPMYCPDTDAIIAQHMHTYDHLSLVAYGAVEVWKDGRSLGAFGAPATIEIEAGCKHAFRPLIPGTLVYCIHAVREGEEAAPIIEEDPATIMPGVGRR